MGETFHQWPWELGAAGQTPTRKEKLTWFWRWQEVMKHRSKRTEIELQQMKRSANR